MVMSNTTFAEKKYHHLSRGVTYCPRPIKNGDHGCAGYPLISRRPNSAAASMGPMGATKHPRDRARAVQAAAVRRGVLTCGLYREKLTLSTQRPKNPTTSWRSIIVKSGGHRSRMGPLHTP